MFRLYQEGRLQHIRASHSHQQKLMSDMDNYPQTGCVKLQLFLRAHSLEKVWHLFFGIEPINQVGQHEHLVFFLQY